MSEHWTDRLSEYLDGELEAPERAACEAHVAGCRECALVLAELRSVVSEASLLPDLPPSRDLWPGIEDRLAPRDAALVMPSDDEDPTGAASRKAGVNLGDGRAVPLERRRRRVSFTVPQLAAAAIALVALSASGMWLALPASGVGDSLAAGDATAAASTPARPADGATPVLFTATYDAAISELEAEFERRREVLDPRTIEVVETNLAIIERAIVDANTALAEDPSSAFLNTHLANAMRQKVDLLRRVATIDLET